MLLARAVLVFIVALFIVAGPSDAMIASRNPQPDGSLITKFAFSTDDVQRLRHQFGYNWELAHRVVQQLISEAGVPRALTTKVALVPAYGIAVSQTAYALWDISLKSSSFTVTYHTYPETFKRVDRVLGGGIGDRIMPFGEMGNAIASVINQIMNTAAVER